MTLVFSVPGISCDHCKHTIEAAAAEVHGVTSVVVDVAAKSVQVEGTAPEPAIRTAIIESGYDVDTVVER